jgi:hypothetical protein
MRFGILGLLVLVGSAEAITVQVERFQVSRTGGGQVLVDVTLTSKGAVSVRTKECGYKELTEEESARTEFEYKGTDVKDAVAILENTAVVAEDHTPRHPGVVAGTWSNLVIAYGYEIYARSGLIKRSAVKDIKLPLVLVEGRLSSILSNIETEARKASASACR